ncbi:hypothetical protein BCEN4_660102 [Burkholderia cenocepacia]|nr:hypothetical protein BCEN4_660102 [Burkholderia cenocepacia]
MTGRGFSLGENLLMRLGRRSGVAAFGAARILALFLIYRL